MTQPPLLGLGLLFLRNEKILARSDGTWKLGVCVFVSREAVSFWTMHFLIRDREYLMVELMQS